MLFVFEPIEYDLERMLLMAPHPNKLPEYAQSEQNRFALQGKKKIDDAFNDAKEKLEPQEDTSRSVDPQPAGSTIVGPSSATCVNCHDDEE